MKIQLRNNANKVYCYTVSTIKFLCSLTDHILHTNVKVALYTSNKHNLSPTCGSIWTEHAATLLCL